MEIIQGEVKHYTPKKTSFKKYLQEDDFALLFFKVIGIVSIICCVVASFSLGLNLQVWIFSVFLIYLASFFAIVFSPPESSWLEKQKEVIISNDIKSNYLLNLGNEVKKFYGSAVKTNRQRNNKIRPILVNAETVKRHFLCMATIGAGKSVFMKGLIEQYAVMGGGCLIVDGKGTDEFAKEIYGLVASVGREDDFVYLNFLDMNNTHTINPLLSGSALSIYEILISLLIGEENEWKAKQKEFMENILKLMVYRRDNEKDFIFNFSMLQEMMSLTTLVKEAIKFKHLAKQNTDINDFIVFVASTIGVDYNDFLNGDVKNQKWVDEMIKASQNTDIQGVYDASVSTGAWRSIMTKLGSNYGKIFNSPNPNMSLWEATQRNKIIFVTLPTMDSDTTPKELGRLILGLIKGVAAQKAKYAREPKIPFICFCDELGSYVVEGYGRLESKSRALGISMIPFFQSPAQIDVIAKNDYERKEIIDVTGVHILMKNMHPETTEFYTKMVPKIKVMGRDYSERRQGVKGQGSVEDNYKFEEKDAIEHNEVVNMNDGEMMVFANGKVHRATANTETTLAEFNKKIAYEFKTKEKIPITQYVSKKLFFKEVEKILNDEIREIINLKQYRAKAS